MIVVVMVVTILATITLAAVSYGAFKVRERRAPRSELENRNDPVFFERVRFVAAEPVEG